MPTGEIRNKWIDSIKLHQGFSSNDEHTSYYAVCSNHFEKSQIYGGVNLRLKSGAYPTIFPTNPNAPIIDDSLEVEPIVEPIENENMLQTADENEK